MTLLSPEISHHLKPINQSNILIAGVARNVATTIEDEIHVLRQACKQFQSTQILVVESDSVDQTIERLTQLEIKIDGFKFLSLGFLEPQIPSRVERIAYCRNQIVSAVRSDPLYAHVDYIALADLDGLNMLMTSKKIESCWHTSEAWDAITANQLDFYYDIYALRHPQWSPGDCLVQQIALEPIIGKESSTNLAVWAKQVQLEPSNRLIEVESAFGGFAIYKKAAFIAGEYKGRVKGSEVCEHVSFHQNIRDAGFRIFINCALVNCKRPKLPINQPPKKRTVFFKQSLVAISIQLFGKKRLKRFLNDLIDLIQN